MAFAETFARVLHQELTGGIAGANLAGMIDHLGRRFAIAVMRPEVVALRRLLIGGARAFPDLGSEYFDRAPGQVLDALATGFEGLGLLRVSDPRLAAAQFAYLMVGAPLDRSMLVRTVAPKEHVIACAREGVQTFLTRCAAPNAAIDRLEEPFLLQSADGGAADQQHVGRAIREQADRHDARD